MRKNEADDVIEISIIGDATDPQRIWWTGVCEEGQATEEDA